MTKDKYSSINIHVYKILTFFPLWKFYFSTKILYIILPMHAVLFCNSISTCCLILFRCSLVYYILCVKKNHKGKNLLIKNGDFHLVSVSGPNVGYIQQASKLNYLVMYLGDCQSLQLPLQPWTPLLWGFWYLRYYTNRYTCVLAFTISGDEPWAISLCLPVQSTML